MHNYGFIVRFDDPKLRKLEASCLKTAVEMAREYLYTFPQTVDNDKIITDSLEYGVLYEQDTSSIKFDAYCTKPYAELRSLMYKYNIGTNWITNTNTIL